MILPASFSKEAVHHAASHYRIIEHLRCGGEDPLNSPPPFPGLGSIGKKAKRELDQIKERGIIFGFIAFPEGWANNQLVSDLHDHDKFKRLEGRSNEEPGVFILSPVSAASCRGYPTQKLLLNKFKLNNDFFENQEYDFLTSHLGLCPEALTTPTLFLSSSFDGEKWIGLPFSELNGLEDHLYKIYQFLRDNSQTSMTLKDRPCREEREEVFTLMAKSLAHEHIAVRDLQIDFINISTELAQLIIKYREKDPKGWESKKIVESINRGKKTLNQFIREHKIFIIEVGQDLTEAQEKAEREILNISENLATLISSLAPNDNTDIDKIQRKFDPKNNKRIATGLSLLNHLDEITRNFLDEESVDYSPSVIMFAKALENEINETIFEKIREFMGITPIRRYAGKYSREHRGMKLAINPDGHFYVDLNRKGQGIRQIQYPTFQQTIAAIGKIRSQLEQQEPGVEDTLGISNDLLEQMMNDWSNGAPALREVRNFAAHDQTVDRHGAEQFRDFVSGLAELDTWVSIREDLRERRRTDAAPVQHAHHARRADDQN